MTDLSDWTGNSPDVAVDYDASDPTLREGGSNLESVTAGVLSVFCRQHGIAPPEREYKFSENRRWRLDFYFPLYGLAIEAHGLYSANMGGSGRHLRPDGFAKDREKMNAATLAGIAVLEYTGEQIKAGDMWRDLELWLGVDDE